MAVEKLFRDNLKAAGGFNFVVSTKIDKGTIDRPHFFLAYGTKDLAGLKVFRQTEYDALRQHVRNRADAKERKREQKAGSKDLFAGVEAEVQEATIDEIVEDQKTLASAHLVATLSEYGPIQFARAVVDLLQAYMLRETNVKDICVSLASAGRIDNTWGGRNRKPTDEHMVRLVSPSRNSG